MSDVPALLEAFEDGSLLRPDYGLPNLVDVARAIGAVGRVPGLELSPFASEFADELRQRPHIVLVLADGLGYEMIEREEAAETLRGHLRRELRTVFPSSTAVALTSLTTGEWPAKHGVTGWWTHIEEIGGPATVLQYRRRSDGQSLSELGVDPAEVFPVPALVKRMRRLCHFLMPRDIAGSIYSRYWSGGPAAAGYPSLNDTFEAALQTVTGADEPTFVYVYAPHVDSESHHAGPDSPGARSAILAVDRLVSTLASGLGDSATIVLTADHGHMPVTAQHRMLIRDSDGIPGMLAYPPAGDSRVVEFHVRPGRHEEFEARFRERFGSAFFLLSTDEVEELRLLGPDPLAEQTRARLGDYMALSRGVSVLGYHPAKASRDALQQRSHHAGLLSAELHIPLVVI